MKCVKLNKGASSVAQTVKNLPAMRETQIPSLGREDSLDEGMAIHSSILAMLRALKVKVTQLCPTLCDLMDYTVHVTLQARILEWVAFSLLQGIFPTQGSNPYLPHCRWILYQLSHQGSPTPLKSPN